MRDILVGPRVPHCNDIKGRDGDRWLEKFKPRFMAAHEVPAKGTIAIRSLAWKELGYEQEAGDGITHAAPSSDMGQHFVGRALKRSTGR